MEGYLCTELFRKSPFQCLAAAIAPHRRKKPARRQFSPLDRAGGVMNPAGLSRIFNPVGLQTWFRRITNHAGTRTDHLGYWSANRMRTAGEGGYSPVFASRAAVPHPVAIDRRSAHEPSVADSVQADLHSGCHLQLAALSGCSLLLHASRLQLRLAGEKSLLGVNPDRSATDRDGRCKYPSTTVFAKIAMEAAAGHFSLNHLSASRFTDVDPRTCYNCK